MSRIPITRRIWRHVRRNEHEYKVLMLATLEKDGAQMVVYESEAGKKWIRPLSEFTDGRFQWFDWNDRTWKAPEEGMPLS